MSRRLAVVLSAWTLVSPAATRDTRLGGAEVEGRESRVGGWVAAGRASHVADASQPKPVLLRIRPKVGDTLRTRFEQIVRSSGNAAGPRADATRASSMQVVSRSIIERSDDAGTVILAITDSVSFVMPGVDERMIAAAAKSMSGRRARMRVTPAGAMELLDPPRSPLAGALKGRADDAARGADVPIAEEPAFARLPGTLPEGPVAVGTTWTREMALPWTGDAVTATGGRVEVLFRLDSLRAGGTIAYVSMRGSLARTTGVRGGRVATKGTMNGHLLVDLRRGWMTDSHATFAMAMTFTPAGDPAAAKPVTLSLTVTQTLHCEP